MSVSILDAILAINLDAQVTIKNDHANHIYDEIIWHEGTTPISDIEIAAKKGAMETAYENDKYKRDRAAAYPSIQDQLDDIYHNGIDGWKATIKTVKDKYPKG